MARKDFNAISTERVYGSIKEATAAPEQVIAETQEVQEVQEEQRTRKARKTYSEEEAQAFKEEMKTAGRKGAKLPRINLAFTPQNYEFIQIMSRVRGESLTEFVNHVLRKSMEDNADIYQKAKDFKNSF